MVPRRPKTEDEREFFNFMIDGTLWMKVNQNRGEIDITQNT